MRITTRTMKTTLLITSLIATTVLSLADGIPVDRKTGKVFGPHTIVALTPSQIEETQTLGTFTLAPEQWEEIRSKWPQCPKRFTIVLPVTWRDCTCDMENYVIALSRDRIAVLLGGNFTTSIEAVRKQIFSQYSRELRLDERGQFYLDGKLIPFRNLLESVAEPPSDMKRSEKGLLVDGMNGDWPNELWLNVELPVGTKPTDAVFHSRLKQLAAVADKVGLKQTIFGPGKE